MGDEAPERIETENSGSEEFLYLSQLVHDGYYNVGVRWGDVKPVFGEILGIDPERACARLKDEGYTTGCEDTDAFMLLREPEIELSGSRMQEMMQGFFKVLDRHPLALNSAMLVYTQRSMIMSILASFYDHEIEFVGKTANRTLIPMITNERFMEIGPASSMIGERINKMRGEVPEIYSYLDKSWFLELMLIIKNGYYGNGSFNYIDSLESSFRSDFITGILDLIRSGTLISIILNFKKILKDEEANRKIRSFVRKSRDEAKLKRFYDWLSIANDLAIGTEFLVGSLEFLPHRNELFGVFLFITGSAQLLIRPLIEISKRAHLSKIYRRKIRF